MASMAQLKNFVAEADNKMGAYEEDEYAGIMSRWDELATEDNGENDEDEDANASERDGVKVLFKCRGTLVSFFPTFHGLCNYS
ncbi:hypothetical protein ES332_A01G021400v1 [Gossypium tomentosum]|uniref:Uncharacterized protein n=1 Tax=Gossypium tomentosum TaxID=34277 RepID=A0A5D2RNM0_GOSTO|nr:hypothetical protein ES332_A01G021400v1 [Gossypium tomentosum]TYI41441.1 hypothetical protein ES332_A01G021400v1 [Gossypium tomentosum]